MDYPNVLSDALFAEPSDEDNDADLSPPSPNSSPTHTNSPSLLSTKHRREPSTAPTVPASSSAASVTEASRSRDLHLDVSGETSSPPRPARSPSVSTLAKPRMSAIGYDTSMAEVEMDSIGGGGVEEDEDDEVEVDEDEDDEVDTSALRAEAEDVVVAEPGELELEVDEIMDDIDLIPELRKYRTVGGLTESMRPAISDLLFGHGDDLGSGDNAGIRAAMAQPPVWDDSTDDDAPRETQKRRFGMWDGVVARCLLSMTSIILFVRLGFVMGVAGVGLGTLLVLLSALMVTLTTLSLSAITTNGQVLPGGVYAIASRALGPQVGGSIGVLFSVANAASVALFLTGFSNQMSSNIDGMPDSRVASMLALLVVFGVCFFDRAHVVKAQVVAFGLVCVAILAIVLGCLFGKADRDAGFVGVRDSQFSSNFGPDWSEGNFLTALGLFFPAMTGSMAGTSISSEIKRPHTSIPYGTLMSIGTGTAVYILVGWLLAASCVRQDGLLENLFIVEDASLWAPLVQVGVYSGTLFSAVSSLMAGANIVQVVARDRIFPWFDPLRDPFTSHVASALVAGVCLIPGDFDIIAPLTSGFFMMSYAAVNLACFFASSSRAPGWRPTFHFYNSWVALGTSCICLVMLVLLSSYMAIVVIVCAAALYKYLERRDPDVNWGSAIENWHLWSALRSLSRLERMPFHVKKYRPHVLVMVGTAGRRPDLVRFSEFLGKSGGAMVYGHVRIASWRDLSDPALHEAQFNRVRARTGKARTNKIADFGVTVRNAFAKEVIAETFSEGVRSLIQATGLSHLLEVNCVMLGFMETWPDYPERCTEYVRAIQSAFMLGSGVMVVRGEGRFFEKPPPYQFKGTIDIWWLYDDGGLNVLIPHLISQHRAWRKHARIRVMTVSVNHQLDRNQVQMSRLLHKLRIDAEIVPVNITVKGSARDVTTIDERVLRHYKSLMNAPPTRRGQRYLKIAELMRKHSADATLLVSTMPMCMVGQSPQEYMAWLDSLSAKPLPPVMLVRGNQETVLTY